MTFSFLFFSSFVHEIVSPLLTPDSCVCAASQQPNVVLANTHELRRPTDQQLADAAAETAPGAASVKMDVMSRFLGLVTIPGEHIVKMEVEEFASQVKGRNPYASAGIV